MIKIICGIFFAVQCLQFCNIQNEKKEEEILDTYVVNNPDWSKEEFTDFFLENKATLCSKSPNYNKILFEGDQINNLDSAFTWDSKPKTEKYVSDTYEGNPSNIKEDDSLIVTAKLNSKIRDYKYIGCGPISLVSQFNFLAKYAGYSQLVTNAKYENQLCTLYKDVFNAVDTEQVSSSGLFSSLSIFGLSFDDGTFTLPSELVNGANKVLSDYNITNGIGPEDVSIDGEFKKVINVKGDYIPSTKSFSQKKADLIKSINNGMPVIWWTMSGDGLGGFKGHYMNIFGYQIWRGVDSKGNEEEHLFFKLHMNWDSYSIDSTGAKNILMMMVFIWIPMF